MIHCPELSWNLLCVRCVICLSNQLLEQQIYYFQMNFTLLMLPMHLYALYVREFIGCRKGKEEPGTQKTLKTSLYSQHASLENHEKKNRKLKNREKIFSFSNSRRVLEQQWRWWTICWTFHLIQFRTPNLRLENFQCLLLASALRRACTNSIFNTLWWKCKECSTFFALRWRCRVREMQYDTALSPYTKRSIHMSICERDATAMLFSFGCQKSQQKVQRKSRGKQTREEISKFNSGWLHWQSYFVCEDQSKCHRLSQVSQPKSRDDVH